MRRLLPSFPLLLLAFPAGLAAQTSRVSVATGGIQADAKSERASISSDARFVVFGSDATNLVAGDFNFVRDVFVHDRQTGTTKLISVSTAGGNANGQSIRPVVSAAGRFVAFQSDASNLVAGDFNLIGDIFLRDRLNQTTVRVSVSTAGLEGNGFSTRPALSADGRFVAYRSGASNLVAGDTNLADDIFVRDTQLGTTVRVSVSSLGAQANGPSDRPAISDDGRFVGFWSDASNLVPGDTNFARDIFVFDLQTGQIVRASISTAGVESNGASSRPSLSFDGRFIAFRSLGSTLVPGDANNVQDVFVRDLVAGTTEIVSIDSSELPANGPSSVPSISDDGRFVAFRSTANNLVFEDTNNSEDVFVRDRTNKKTFRVSVSSSNTQADASSSRPSVDATGTVIAFQGVPTNLVPGDTNLVKDIFVRDGLPPSGGPSLHPGIGTKGKRKILTNPPSLPRRHL
ncbi:MAG: TolB family protein [Planctomycetota bacterium]